MVRWAVREKADHVLDGGAGESAFLVAAGARLLDLGAEPEAAIQQIHGVELDPLAAEVASKAVAAALDLVTSQRVVTCGSFFDEAPRASLPLVQACIGNPPYIRYQSFSGDIRKEALRRAAEGGVKLSGLTSSWAPFLVHACRFLAPDGRLAQVLPAELLQTGYAQPIRDFLTHRFGSVSMIVFEARVFPGALEEVVLILASDDGRPGLQVREAKNLSDLDRIIQGNGSRIRSVAHPKGKWTRYLLQHDELRAYQECVHDEGVARFLEYGRTDIGVVTGANSFFALNEDNAKGAKLPPDDLLPAISKAEHVQGLRLTEKDLIALRASGEPSWLFHPSGDPLSEESASYVRSGEWVGLHNRYKCRTREPWWRVPGVKVPDAFITYMSNRAPRLVLNEGGAVSTNTVHRIYLQTGMKRFRRTLPVIVLNSLTLLSAELEGRSYGGGVLKLEPKECGQLLVPRMEALDQSTLKELQGLLPRFDRLLRDGGLVEAVAEVDRIVLHEAIGLPMERIEKLKSGRGRLLQRRMARMSSKPA